MGFKPKREYPAARTLYDNLPAGITETGSDKPPESAVLALPEATVLVRERPADETTPALSRTRRFTLADVSTFAWLFERLAAKFPGVLPQSWAGRLTGYSSDSSYFFQRTERAVGLAMAVREPLGTEIYVLPLFILHTDVGPEGGSLHNSKGERDAIHLLNEMALWGKRQGANEVRKIGAQCELPPGRLVERHKCEKRDEIFLRIV